MNPTTVAADGGWDGLHSEARFLPFYPSEPVIRFVARGFGEARADLLDVGCGAGRHLLFAADLGHRVSGCDISSEGVTVARRRLHERGHRGRLEVASFTDLPYEDESFDGVISYGVFYYADGDGFQQGVDEAHRVMRPGGRLLVIARTTDDHRFGRGDEVATNTFRLTTDETNEKGMVVHFLKRSDIDRLFRRFDDVVVDRVDHTANGGTIMNSDWVIEARR